MSLIKYVILNGKPYKIDEPVFMHSNRAFRFGDALFETMHANGTEIQFFDDHFERMKKAMSILKMNFSNNLNKSILYAEIKSLLVRNKLFQGAKVRLSIFRDGAGTYTPETNNVSYFIETEKLDSDLYILNHKGFIIDIYQEIKKPINQFSLYKSSNAQLFVMASIHKNEHNVDDVLIINENGNIIEATSSNVFLVKKNQIFTPSIEEGCVNGIMRNRIIEIAIQKKYTVFDDCRITMDDLLNSDEVFLTNAVKGIQWILAYKNRRYFNKVSKALLIELNRIAFN
jgi:branched-subunit amino acid aminotransferase/4-amino-4-deoxychorismate lyase